MGFSDTKMIGAMLCFIGASFFGFGVMFLLDRKLLTIGNILFLSGLTVNERNALLLRSAATGPRRWETDRTKSTSLPKAMRSSSVVLIVCVVLPAAAD